MGDVLRFEPRSLAAIELESWPRDLLPHVSASAIKQAYRCPEQFRRRRILGHKEAPAAALTIGTAHHRGIELNMGQKVETREDLPLEVVKDAARDFLLEEVEEKGGVHEYPEWKDAPEKKLGEAVDVAVALQGAYHKLRAPELQPVTVEQRFELLIPGIPVPVIGYIDLEADVLDPLAALALMAGDAVEFAPVTKIVENKTSGRENLSNENRVQGWIYQLARPLPVTYDLSIKTKVPKIIRDDPRYQLDVAPRPRSLALVTTAMRAIAHYIAVYGPDHPWPGAFGGFADTCGYCGFRPTCPWWNNEATPWLTSPVLDPLPEEADIPIEISIEVGTAADRREDDDAAA